MTEYEYTDELLRTALDIGEHMLLNGADVTRVEDTVTRICKLHDYAHIEVFCISSLLQASIRLHDGQYLHEMRRIQAGTNNLARLERLNAISRDLCSGKMTLEEAHTAIKEVKILEPYKPWAYYLAAVVGASAFCIFFGGSLLDGLCAAIAALPVMFMDRHPLQNSNPLVHTVFESFIGGLIGNLLVIIGLGQNVNLVCIGVLMLLIPGVKFGNAMQDFTRADVLAGSAKLVDAILITMMIVMGLGISMLVFGKWAI